MGDFIATIKNSVQQRADLLKYETLNFCDIFNTGSRPAIIAEIKFASPSRGRIYPGDLDAVAIAGEYLAHGAAALSILTEPEYFKGKIETIRQVRAAYPAAQILQKDFILSKEQILQGLSYGANAILLIVAFLTPQRLRELYDYATNLGLTALIEVHNLAELEIALALNPELIGINHRNLTTLAIDLTLSATLIKAIPAHIRVIAESGLTTSADLIAMRDLAISGCLIGSHFMQHAHPGLALQQLLGAPNEN